VRWTTLRGLADETPATLSEFRIGSARVVAAVNP
jgi:hypothetical protein